MALFRCRELFNIGGGFVAIAGWMQEPCFQVGLEKAENVCTLLGHSVPLEH